MLHKSALYDVQHNECADRGCRCNGRRWRVVCGCVRFCWRSGWRGSARLYARRGVDGSCGREGGKALNGAGAFVCLGLSQIKKGPPGAGTTRAWTSAAESGKVHVAHKKRPALCLASPKQHYITFLKGWFPRAQCYTADPKASCALIRLQSKYFSLSLNDIILHDALRIAFLFKAARRAMVTRGSGSQHIRSNVSTLPRIPITAACSM